MDIQRRMHLKISHGSSGKYSSAILLLNTGCLAKLNAFNKHDLPEAKFSA